MDHAQEIQERDRISELKNERIHLQKKTFTKWVNAFLEDTGHTVNDIFTDLGDGKLLTRLVEIISGDKIGNTLKGNRRIHKIENVARVLEYLKKSVKLESIGPEDIVDGKEELILGLLWTIILRLSISDVQEESGDGKTIKDSLLLWCQRKTKGYTGVDIKNFSSSWKSGLAFNALIHAHRSDLFQYSTLEGNNHLENLEHAFQVAEDKLSIKRLLDPQDIDVPRPDDKSIMTYVGLMYQYFAKLNKEKTGERRLGKFIAELDQLDKLKTSYIEMVTGILKWIKIKTETLETTLPSNEHSLRKEIDHFKTFRNVEKPNKSTERMNIEMSLFNIQSKLQTKRYKVFVPPVGMTIVDIHKAWIEMEMAEKARDDGIKKELCRHERISHLLKKFQQKVKLREAWSTERLSMLQSEKNIHELHLHNVTTSLKRQQALETQVKAQESRFAHLESIMQELTSLEYDQVEKVLNRIDKLKDNWKKVLRKLSARKKTLSSLQQVASVSEEIHDLNISLVQLQDSLGNHLQVASLMDIDDGEQQNSNINIQLNNLQRQCDVLKKKVDVFINSRHQYAQLISTRFQMVTDLLQELFTNGKRREKLFSSFKQILIIKKKLDEELQVLNECKQMATLHDQNNVDLVDLNRLTIKHQQLIAGVGKCENTSETLWNEWSRLSSSFEDYNELTDDANTCCSMLNHLKGELENVKQLVNFKSQKLLLEIIASQSNSNMNEIEIWMKEKRNYISTLPQPKDVNATEVFLKNMSNLQTEMVAYEPDMKLIRDQTEDIVWFQENPSYLFRTKAIVKKKHAEQEETFRRGEVVYISPVSEDVWKVKKRNFKKELHLKISVDIDSGDGGVLLVSVMKSKFDHLETNTACDVPPLTSEMFLERSSERAVAFFGLFSDLKSQLQDSKEFLLKMKDFFLAKEKINELMVWGHYALKYMQNIDLHGDINTIQRQIEKVGKEMEAYKPISESISTNCLHLMDQNSPMKKPLLDMRKTIHKMMENISVEYSSLNDAFLKIHGVKLLEDETKKLSLWIEEKMAIITNTVGLQHKTTNVDLNMTRRTQKTLQTTRAEILSIEQCSKELNTKLEAVAKAQPELLILKRNLNKQLNDLKESSQTAFDNIRTSYGRQGFLADSEELLMRCKEQEFILNQNMKVENLQDVRKSHNFLQSVDGEVSVLVKAMQDLIDQGETLQCVEVSGTLQTLKDSLNSLKSLWRSRTEDVDLQKHYFQLKDTLDCCNRDIEDMDNSIENMDATKDKLKITAVEFSKDFEKLSCKLPIVQSKVCSVRKALEGSYTKKEVFPDEDVRSVLATTFRSLDKTAAALKGLGQEAGELACFEHYSAECKQLCDWINEKLSCLLTNERCTTTTSISAQLKVHENIQLEILSHEVSKIKLDEMASLYLEECHFASQNISDLSDEVDACWMDLNERFKHRKEALNKLITKESLETKLSVVEKWCVLAKRKLLHDVCARSSSSSNKLLKDHKYVISELALKLKETQSLFEKAVELNEESVIRASKNAVKELENMRYLAAEKLTRLLNDKNLHQFLLQCQMERLWIEEQNSFLESLIDSPNLIQACSTAKSLELLSKKLTQHEQSFTSCKQFALQCINNDHINSERISVDLATLQASWDELIATLHMKTDHQKETVSVLQYVSDAAQHLQTIDEKISRVLKTDYGKDLSSSEIALKRHKQFIAELLQYKKILKQFVKKSSSIDSVDVKSAANNIKNNFKKLEKCCETRHKMLQSSCDLFLLYFEAENFKSSLVELNREISSDNYGKSYEEVLLLIQRFDNVSVKVKSLKEPYCRLEKFCQELVLQHHPYEENVKQLSSKIESMYKRVIGKFEQREKKLKNLSKYHHLSLDISNVSNCMSEFHIKLQTFESTLDRYETIPALREEYRQLNLLINESKHVPGEIKSLNTELLRGTEKDHQSKNVKKLSEHLRNAQNSYQIFVQRADLISRRFHVKIDHITFDGEVNHLREWYKQAKEDLTLSANCSIDFNPLQEELTRVQLKSNEMELKQKKLTELHQNIEKLQVTQDEKDKLLESLTEISTMKDELQNECQKCLQALNSKASGLSLSKEIESVLNIFHSIEKSLGTLKVADKSKTKLLAISRRKTELKNLFDVQKQKIELLTNLQKASSISINEADALTILKDRETTVSQKIEDLSDEIKRAVTLNSFLQQFEEFKAWAEDTVKDLSTPSVVDLNLKTIEKSSNRLDAEIRSYHSNYNNLLQVASKLTSDDCNEYVHENVNIVTTQWKRLIDLHEDRKRTVDERKAFCEFEKNIELLHLHIDDQVKLLKSMRSELLNLEESTMTLRSINSVKNNVDNLQQRIEQVNIDQSQLIVEYPHLKCEAYIVTDKLQSNFRQLHDMMTTTNHSVNQSIYNMKFVHFCTEIETRIIETEENLSVGVDVDGKNLDVTLKRFMTIEQQLNIIRERRRTLVEVSSLLQQQPNAPSIEARLLQLDQSFVNLVEKAKKQKLILEAQKRLQSFLQDVDKTSQWLHDTVTRVQNNTMCVNINDVQINTSIHTLTRLLRKNAEWKFEASVKRKFLLKLKQRGQILIQDGQLSAMEVDSRLNNLESGFASLDEVVTENETMLLANSSGQEIENKISSMCEWLNGTAGTLRAMAASCDDEEELRLRIDDCSMMKNSLQKIEENLGEDLVAMRKCNPAFSKGNSVFEKVEKQIFNMKNDLCATEKELNSQMELLSLQQDISQAQIWLTQKNDDFDDDTNLDIGNIDDMELQSDDLTQRLQVLCCYNGTIEKIKGRCEQLNTLSDTVYPQFVALKQQYETLCVKYDDKGKLLKLRLQNEYVHVDLMGISDHLTELERSMAEVQYTEDNEKLETFIQILEDVDERLATMRERFSDVIITHGLMERNMDKTTMMTERFSTFEKLHQNKAMLVHDMKVFLRLRYDICEHLAWSFAKNHVLDNQSYGKDTLECYDFIRQIKYTMNELTKHKCIGDVISVTLEHLKNTTQDETFQEHVKNEIYSFQMSTHHFEQKLDNRHKILSEALLVHQCANECDHLISRFEDMCELLQDISTASNKDTATKLLQKNEYHQQLLSSFRKDILRIQHQVDEFSSLVCFQSFERNLTTKMELLRRLEIEAVSLIKRREHVLQCSAQFYKFKCELSFLDKWIQDQISHMKTDGIGSNPTECKRLLKETEDIAKNLIAKETRVAEFGILSQEITKIYPASSKQVTKNTSNVYEMWNDVKELLQSRLETLEAASSMHAFNQTVINNITWTNKLINVLSRLEFNDVSNTKCQQSNLVLYQSQHEKSVKNYNDVVERKSTLTAIESDIYLQLVAPSWSKFEDLHKTLNIKMEEIYKKLDFAVKKRDFTRKCFKFGNWLVNEISNMQLMSNATNEKQIPSYSQYQQEVFKKDSRLLFYESLSEKSIELTRARKDVQDEIYELWHPIEANWCLLTDLLSEWHHALLQLSDSQDAMDDLVAVEYWINEQEKLLLCTEVMEESSDAKLNEALYRYSELDEEFILQDEKVRLASLKVDSMQAKTNRRSCSGASTTCHLKIDCKQDSCKHQQKILKPIHLKSDSHVVPSDAEFGANNFHSYSGSNIGQNQNKMSLNGQNNDNYLSVVDQEEEGTDTCNQSCDDKTLTSLLKSSTPFDMRNNREPKKRVAFSTTHEFSDGCGNITNFYQLNDEFDETVVNDDLLYENDDSYEEFSLSDSDYEGDDGDLQHNFQDFPSPPNEFMETDAESKQGNNNDDVNGEHHQGGFWSNETTQLSSSLCQSEYFPNVVHGDEDSDVYFSDSDVEASEVLNINT